MRKGFTLVELLAVIVILGVLALITFPIIDKSIKQSKEKALEKTIASVIEASINYSIQNDLGYSSNYKKLEFETLIDAGFLKKEIINPITNQKLQGCVLYKWDSSYNQYEFEYSEACEMPTLTIKDIVLSNFPYLELGENGCKNPGDNNYSYMGGCYLKGSNLTGKDIFYSIMSQIEMDNNTITTTFFDSEDNFIEDNFNNWFKDFVNQEEGMTEDDINQLLQDEGVSTIFELFMVMLTEKPMKSEELFSQKVLNNSLWYSGFLWSIMGVNSDGTIRLITKENLTSIPWGEEETSHKWDESYVKDWLNNYFYSKLKGNDIIVEQTWCSEIATDENSKRISCKNNLSKEKAKVGLLTLDEYNLADGTISYLNIGTYHQTMTPQDNSNLTWGIIELGYGSGSPYVSGVNMTFGIRAVINVNSDTIITGGNGGLGEIWNSEEGPYILNDDKNNDITGKLNENAISGEYVLFAGHRYRVIDKDKNDNIKLILEGFYKESEEKKYEIEYGVSNTFTTSSGVGQKLNTDVLNWLIPINDTINRSKIITNYIWYQNDFDYCDSYKLSLDENNPKRSVTATVGLIRVGEMLSGQSSSIFNLNLHDINTTWTMTTYIKEPYAWYILDGAYAGNSFNHDSTQKELFNGLRPVIVIKSNVEIIKGTGTFSNPYQI